MDFFEDVCDVEFVIIREDVFLFRFGKEFFLNYEDRYYSFLVNVVFGSFELCLD